MSLEKLNQELKAIGIDEIKDVDADPCPERTRYFTFKNEANYDDKNWVKKLKSISDTYFINFYKI